MKITKVIRTDVAGLTKLYDKLLDVKSDGFSPGRVSEACSKHMKYRGYWWDYGNAELKRIIEELSKIDKEIKNLQLRRDSLISEFAITTSLQDSRNINLVATPTN